MEGVQSPQALGDKKGNVRNAELNQIQSSQQQQAGRHAPWGAAGQGRAGAVGLGRREQRVLTGFGTTCKHMKWQRNICID